MPLHFPTLLLFKPPCTIVVYLPVAVRYHRHFTTTPTHTFTWDRQTVVSSLPLLHALFSLLIHQNSLSPISHLMSTLPPLMQHTALYFFSRQKYLTFRTCPICLLPHFYRVVVPTHYLHFTATHTHIGLPITCYYRHLPYRCFVHDDYSSIPVLLPPRPLRAFLDVSRRQNTTFTCTPLFFSHTWA